MASFLDASFGRAYHRHVRPKTRKVWLALIALVLGILTAVPTAKAVDKDIFVPPDDHEPGQHNIQFSDSAVDYFSALINPSRLRDYSLDPTCKTSSDPSCIGASLQFTSILPFCGAEIVTNCVFGVAATSPQDRVLEGKFLGKFPKRAENEYQGDEALHLPYGTSASLFDFPEAPHVGGTQYLVTAFMAGTLDAARNANLTKLSEFLLRIVPVKIVPLSSACTPAADQPYLCVDSGFTYVMGQDGIRRWGSQGPGTDGKQACVVRSPRENLCAETYNFPAGFKFAAKIRTNLQISGWLHGRVFEPDITINNIGTNTELFVQAMPVRVPKLYKMNYWKDLPSTIRDQYNESTGQLKNGQSSGFSRVPLPNQSNPLTRNLTLTPQPFDFSGIRELQLWLPYLDDRATAVQSTWVVRTLSDGEISGANRCFTNSTQINGIVATNATQYSAGPPEFKADSGVLDYKVAAPHYDSSGGVFKGQYSLAMRSDVARCLYGFSNAPLRAELSVIDSQGVAQLATLSVSESSGWLKMNASNFEFSAPVIRAKILEEIVPIPAATVLPSMETAGASVAVKTEAPSIENRPNPVITTSPSKLTKTAKKTVICTKGKVVTKLTASKQTCPRGFKKVIR